MLMLALRDRSNLKNNLCIPPWNWLEAFLPSLCVGLHWVELGRGAVHQSCSYRRVGYTLSRALCKWVGDIVLQIKHLFQAFWSRWVINPFGNKRRNEIECSRRQIGEKEKKVETSFFFIGRTFSFCAWSSRTDEVATALENPPISGTNIPPQIREEDREEEGRNEREKCNMIQ